MKPPYIILGFLAFVMNAHGQDAPHPDDIPLIMVSPGVELKELIGRSGKPGAKTEQASVAFFHLNVGRASAWSYNKVGEESFLVLKGHGEVWMGNKAHAVRPGSFVLVPPGVVRSVRASKGEVLEFYAITTPAWTSADDVLTTAPIGAPQ
jgi:mannose-6-phosphate isomerase-like protein (cupin superfamily)